MFIDENATNEPQDLRRSQRIRERRTEISPLIFIMEMHSRICLVRLFVSRDASSSVTVTR